MPQIGHVLLARLLSDACANLQRATSGAAGAAAAAAAVATAAANREPVHLKLTEKVSASVKRDGVLESAEIAGSVNLNIADPKLNTITLHARNEDTTGVQLQVHPHLDKAAWQSESVLRLKNAQKPFPANRDIDILKWLVPLKEEAALPLTRKPLPPPARAYASALFAVTVWPNESSSGCTVNIEYTLQIERLTLSNIEISVPLP